MPSGKFTQWWRPHRRVRPSAESRTWVHPSELPSFEKLATTNPRVHVISPRIVAGLMAVLLVIGGIVLIVNRGASSPVANLPAHLATTVKELPASSRLSAAHIVDLTITTPGHVIHVGALVLPHNLAVTTTFIPVNALITGSTATKLNFPVTLVGRDNVMDFSIVRLGTPVTALRLDAMPASTAVTAVAAVVSGSTKAPEFDWSLTTLGDPSNNNQGVVSYLATQSDTSLSKYVDAIAIDQRGRVVAVLSSRHQWYSARFVAQVAAVVATGRGCHAELGVIGKDEQGGGVLVTHVIPYSAAAHANVKVGDIITDWNGAALNDWQQLVSTLYLTPAYTTASLTFDHHTTVHHTTVSLGCPSKLVP